MKTNNFTPKSYTRGELRMIVAEDMENCLQPILKELGKVIEGLQQRIVDLEVANNAMIEEMKAWKEKKQKVLQ